MSSIATTLAMADPRHVALVEYETYMEVINLHFIMFQWLTLTGAPVKTNK